MLPEPRNHIYTYQGNLAKQGKGGAVGIACESGVKHAGMGGRLGKRLPNAPHTAAMADLLPCSWALQSSLEAADRA